MTEFDNLSVKWIDMIPSANIYMIRLSINKTVYLYADDKIYGDNTGKEYDNEFKDGVIHAIKKYLEENSLKSYIDKDVLSQIINS